MQIEIILKDDNGRPVIDPLTGRLVKEAVSEAVAAYIAEHDAYLDKLEHIDERHFGLVHFDKLAWENMHGLSTGFSAEDEYLGVSMDSGIAEQAVYRERLELCRRLLPLVREACTATQWRRFILHELHGLSYREIALREGLNDKSIVESVHAARKKIKILFSKWA